MCSVYSYLLQAGSISSQWRQNAASLVGRSQLVTAGTSCTLEISGGQGCHGVTEVALFLWFSRLEYSDMAPISTSCTAECLMAGGQSLPDVSHLSYDLEKMKDGHHLLHYSMDYSANRGPQYGEDVCCHCVRCLTQASRDRR